MQHLPGNHFLLVFVFGVPYALLALGPVTLLSERSPKLEVLAAYAGQIENRKGKMRSMPDIGVMGSNQRGSEGVCQHLHSKFGA